MTIKLGDLARDKITGFEGVVVAITEWISGCSRITLQPPIDKDGKVVDGQTFDAPMLELVRQSKIAVGPKETGGPRPAPRQAPTIR